MKTAPGFTFLTGRSQQHCLPSVDEPLQVSLPRVAGSVAKPSTRGMPSVDRFAGLANSSSEFALETGGGSREERLNPHIVDHLERPLTRQRERQCLGRFRGLMATEGVVGGAKLVAGSLAMSVAWGLFAGAFYGGLTQTSAAFVWYGDAGWNSTVQSRVCSSFFGLYDYECSRMVYNATEAVRAFSETYATATPLACAGVHVSAVMASPILMEYLEFGPLIPLVPLNLALLLNVVLVPLGGGLGSLLGRAATEVVQPRNDTLVQDAFRRGGGILFGATSAITLVGLAIKEDLRRSRANSRDEAAYELADSAA